VIEVDLPPKVDALVVRTPTCWFFVGSLSNDDGYNPGALQAAMLVGDPRRDQLALF
jgi:hypothetical protein